MLTTRRIVTRHTLVAGATAALGSRYTLAATAVCAAASASSASHVAAYSTFRVTRAATAASASTSTSTQSAVPVFRPRHRQEWALQPNPQLIALDNLQPKEGAIKARKRYGRGPGSGLGKTAGKGHKGQGQRKGLRKRGFEGGSTPFWRRTPKLGLTNAQRYWKMLTPLSLAKVQQWIDLGRIDGTQLITMRTLYDSGCLANVVHGVKLLSGGLTTLKRPIHLQLTDCSEQARTLLESNGGSVHLVWFNKTTLRAHLNPIRFLQKHGRLPRATGVPPPKKAAKYGFVVEHVDY